MDANAERARGTSGKGYSHPRMNSACLVRWWWRVLKGAFAEEKVDDVAFMWLQPVEGQRFDFADVEPINIRGIKQLSLEAFIVSDRRADQRRADATDHFRLRAFDDGREWEHVLGVGEWVIGALTMHDRWTQVITAFLRNVTWSAAIAGRDFRCSWRLQVAFNLVVDGLGSAGNTERCEGRLGIGR